MDLAKAAFTAQGGEKFRTVQNMMLRGSVSLYPPNSPQSIPGAFSIVTANDKLRMEIDARQSLSSSRFTTGSSHTARCRMWASPPKFGFRC